MDTGQKASAIGHLALVGWVMVGDLFGPREIPFEFAEVTVISGEEFAALQAEAAAPRAVEEPPPAEAEMAEPEPPQEAPPPEPEPPPPVPEPEPEPLPTPPEPVQDAPILPTPPVTDAGDPAARLESTRPRPRPAPRVAPVTAEAPPPEAEIAPEVREAPEPAEVAEEAVPVEEITPTAPEEAAPEIVTEAEEPSRGTQALAPASSPRPRARPAQPPVPQVAEPAPETPQPAPETPSTEDAIAAALAEAMAATEATSETGGTGTAASGPPLTSGERDALRIAVQQCWNVGSLSTEALRTTVTVGVSVARDGRPEGGSIRMISAEGGSAEAARQAFEAARRAIVRCGASGFPLPADKYDHWRDIEMTFNPESMRIR